ncbi:hypothetical protein DOTSEDRAFT_69094 [Dothistroma septosporum NZE10]|uniref:PLC-like phosphodiesterase n=1 Tax=Dothistroma septosporum (strain NZE10 / CBS 128990) TaxID=675120 RepID=N1PU56_DOTSN|nr:hypothetical protein DOTSEDRAFT_69094 [Dothistroma septosporum NZE10]
MNFSDVLAAFGVAVAVTLELQFCNGRAEFCDTKYSNVSLIGTHNAPFVGDINNGFVDQGKTVTEQLDAGIRFLTGQTHKSASNDAVAPLEELYMCHTSCAFFNAGKLVDYLTTVNDWVAAHPDEVVTLLLTNGDDVDVTAFEPAFEQSGIKNLTFVPSTSPNKLPMNQWPTYAQMIASGKRVVVFLDYKANETEVPYILDEFTYYFETPFSQTDPTFSECNLDRPANGTADGRMYIVNHVLDKDLIPGDGDILVPDVEPDYAVNAATGNGSIGSQSDLCTSKWGRVPNVILVDRFDRGDVFTAQNNLNDISSA